MTMKIIITLLVISVAPLNEGAEQRMGGLLGLLGSGGAGGPLAGLLGGGGPMQQGMMGMGGGGPLGMMGMGGGAPHGMMGMGGGAPHGMMGTGGSSEEEEEKGCIPMCPKSIMKICTANTDVAEKIGAAMEKCKDQLMERELRVPSELDRARRRKKSKKSKKAKKAKKAKQTPTTTQAPATCPSFDEVNEMMMEELGGIMCLFSEMGWIDEEEEFHMDTFVTDLESLPESVASLITEESVDECAEAMMESSADTSMEADLAKLEECMSEDQMKEISEMMMQGAMATCTVTMIKGGCKDFVKELLGGGPPMPMGK